MSKHLEIYGDKFGTLFVGVAPAGMELDVRATEDGMQADLDDARQEWIDQNPEPDREAVTAREYIEWEDSRDSAFAQIGERLSQSAEWYESNYVWIDA